jgi:hypothetical protein
VIPADILTNPAFTVLGRVFNYPDVQASRSIAWTEALGRRFRTLLLAASISQQNEAIMVTPTLDRTSNNPNACSRR